MVEAVTENLFILAGSSAAFITTSLLLQSGLNKKRKGVSFWQRGVGNLVYGSIVAGLPGSLVAILAKSVLDIENIIGPIFIGIFINGMLLWLFFGDSFDPHIPVHPCKVFD